MVYVYWLNPIAGPNFPLVSAVRETRWFSCCLEESYVSNSKVTDLRDSAVMKGPPKIWNLANQQCTRIHRYQKTVKKGMDTFNMSESRCLYVVIAQETAASIWWQTTIHNERYLRSLRKSAIFVGTAIDLHQNVSRDQRWSRTKIQKNNKWNADCRQTKRCVCQNAGERR